MKIKKILSTYPSFVFISIFPGFFFYQTLIGLGFIPPILGGYFGIVSAINFPILIFIFFRDRHKIRFFNIDYAFFFIIFMMISVAIFNYDTVALKDHPDLLIWSLSGALFNILCYCLARYVDFENKWFKLCLKLCCLLMCLIIFYYSSNGVFSLRETGINSDSVSTYQALGRSLAISGLCLVATSSSIIIEIVVSIFLICALFFNGARTEFIFFLISLISLFILRSSKSYRNALIGVSILLFLAVLFLNYWDFFLELLPDTRILQVLDISESSSFEARSQLSVQAIETINQFPLLGQYGIYVKTGGVGSYAHNLLSAWVNLGLIGFLVYAACLIYMLYKNFVWIIVSDLTSNKVEIFKLSYLFCCFVVLAMLTSKDYTYMLFGFSVGLCSRCITCMKWLKTYQVLQRK